jgi:hypothetical protein
LAALEIPEARVGPSTGRACSLVIAPAIHDFSAGYREVDDWEMISAPMGHPDRPARPDDQFAKED